MKTLFQNNHVEETFNAYPIEMREKLFNLRELIFEVAAEMKIDDLEETLKWGEPSYLTKKGSAVRLAWRKSSPNQYGIFFNCKTSLIDTFKEVYQGFFKFEGNRAIVFELKDDIPLAELKHCISLSFCYKKIKHLPLLGL